MSVKQINSVESVSHKKTSEELYGIIKQPVPTCPIINEALTEVNEMQKLIRGYERADENELKSMLSDIEYKLGLLSGYSRSGLLEDVRENCELIRNWGEEWKTWAKNNSLPIEDIENCH